MRYRALLCTIVLAGCADLTAPPSAPPAVASARQAIAPGNASFDAKDGEDDHGNKARQGEQGDDDHSPTRTTMTFTAADCSGHLITGTAEVTVVNRTFIRDGKTFMVSVMFERVRATLVGNPAVEYAGTQVSATTSILAPGTTTTILFGDLDLFAVHENAPDVFVDFKIVLVNGVIDPARSQLPTIRCPAT
jgi:hypothetical protein